MHTNFQKENMSIMMWKCYTIDKEKWKEYYPWESCGGTYIN
jgi:hypothetical protein